MIRYHLALNVPAETPTEIGTDSSPETEGGRCRVRIGDRSQHWTEGASLVFDDTVEHEVWSDTDEERVVLFLDVLRPLRFPMNVFNRFVVALIAHSPFVTDAKRRQRSWEREFALTAPERDQVPVG